MDQAWCASKIAWFQTHKDDSYGSLSTVSLCCTQLFIHQHLFVVARWYTPSSNLFSFQRTPPLGVNHFDLPLQGRSLSMASPKYFFFWFKNEKNPLQDDGKRLWVAKCSDPAVAALLCGSYKCGLPDLRSDSYWKIHHFQWEIRYKSPFSIAMLNYQRVPRIPAPSSFCGSSFSRYAGFQNHGKVVYLKEVSEESPEAITHCFVSGVGSLWLPSYPKRFCFCCEAFYLYFWSDDVPDFQGWWYGPQHVAKWNITPRQSIFGRYRPDHHHPTVLEVLNQRPQGSIVVYA